VLLEELEGGRAGVGEEIVEARIWGSRPLRSCMLRT
jgi:hypothetical protein